MAVLRGCYLPAYAGDVARELRRRGFRFVMRCYSHDPACCLGRAEVLRLTAAGLRIGACWASDGRVLTRRQGLLDGAAVLALARAAGQPPGSTVYVGLDLGLSASMGLDEPFAAWLRGMRVALGGGAGYRVGVRGDAAQGARMRDRRLAACVWAGAPAATGIPDLLEWPALTLGVREGGREIVPLIAGAGREPGLFGVDERSVAIVRPR